MERVQNRRIYEVNRFGGWMERVDNRRMDGESSESEDKWREFRIGGQMGTGKNQRKNGKVIIGGKVESI